MRGLKRCLWLVAVLLPMLTPLCGESRDKIVAKICDFLIGNYSTGEVAEAVKSAYGQCQGEDVCEGDFSGFLPPGSRITHKNICTAHNRPEQGTDGETYKICVKFTYYGRYFAYLFSAVQAFPGNPVTLKEVFLHEEKNGSYKKIADLKW